MSNPIKTHYAPPALQGIEQAWYAFREEITSWPTYRKSDNTYISDFTTLNAVSFKRLDSDYPAYQYQETQKTDANGSYKEQLITGLTVGSFKDQTNIYQQLINKQIIVIFKTPDGKLRVMGNQQHGARIVANTDTQTIGANNAPGENYQITYKDRNPCPFYEGTAAVDEDGNLRVYYRDPFILEEDDFPYIMCAMALKKLHEDYAGPCIKIRRSSDNALLDIGFKLDGNIDTDAILTFVGAGGSAFIRTWYDQGYIGQHFIQTTNADQPRICDTGVIDVNPETGMPSIWFPGMGEYLSRAGYEEPEDECLLIAFGAAGSLAGEGGWRSTNWSSNDHTMSIQGYYTNLYLRCVNSSASFTPLNTGYDKTTITWEVDGNPGTGGDFQILIDGTTTDHIGPPNGSHPNQKDAVTDTKYIDFIECYVSAIIDLNYKSLTDGHKDRFKAAYL